MTTPTEQAPPQLITHCFKTFPLDELSEHEVARVLDAGLVLLQQRFRKLGGKLATTDGLPGAEAFANGVQSQDEDESGENFGYRVTRWSKEGETFGTVEAKFYA
jgi:hypothetical protein